MYLHYGGSTRVKVGRGQPNGHGTAEIPDLEERCQNLINLCSRNYCTRLLAWVPGTLVNAGLLSKR